MRSYFQFNFSKRAKINRMLQNLNLSEFVDKSFFSRIEKEGVVTAR